MSKSTRLKTRAHLFKEEEVKSLPEMFLTNIEIILHFQFRRSMDKITPTQKIIACTIGHDHIAKCSGLSNCPENCILFAVKKPEEALFYITAHFDGKIVEDITDGKNQKEIGLLSLLVSINGVIKLLGIPAMEHGASQYDD